MRGCAGEPVQGVPLRNQGPDLPLSLCERPRPDPRSDDLPLQFAQDVQDLDQADRGGQPREVPARLPLDASAGRREVVCGRVVNDVPDDFNTLCPIFPYSRRSSQPDHAPGRR